MLNDIATKRIDDAWSEAEISGDERFTSLFLEDYRQKATRMLRPLAQQQSLTLDDLYSVIAPLLEIEKKELEEDIKCQRRSEDLNVYYVYNTADRKLTVLAKSYRCARYIAYVDGHIHKEKNGRAFQLKDGMQKKLLTDGSALGRALRDGYPGVIENIGGSVVNKSWEKVYMPMTVVSND
jgi:hypothetical protein